MKITGNIREPRMADQIIALLQKNESGAGHVEDYENGREHGYVLTDDESGASVTFAENRNSDDAVVYMVDWNRDSEDEKEAAWKAARYFRDAKGAAHFIIETFRKARAE